MKQRRNKGSGSIIKTESGYKAKLTVDGVTKVRRAKTKREAQEKLELLQAEFEKKQSANITDATVPEYFNKFLQYKQEQLNLTSYRRLESTVNNQIIPYFDCLYLKDLTPEIIKERLNEAYESGLSHSSVKKIYEAFTGCFRYATDIAQDIEYRDNPMLGVNMIPQRNFKQANNAKRILSAEEREAFIAEATRTYKTGAYIYRYGPALVFILNTGLREGEMCGLKKANIDTNKKLAFICDSAETIKDTDGAYKTRLRPNQTKYSSERYVPLNAAAMNVVNKLNDEYDLLIHSQDGGVVPPAQLTKTFRKICEKAHIDIPKGVGCHCLRHTFASTLFEKHVDITIISDLLGHSSVGVTQNTYITIINRIKAEAVELPEM